MTDPPEHETVAVVMVTYNRASLLTRMLAGLPDSDLGIAHAEELLAVAGKEKHA